MRLCACVHAGTIVRKAIEDITSLPNIEAISRSSSSTVGSSPKLASPTAAWVANQFNLHFWHESFTKHLQAELESSLVTYLVSEW